MDVVESRVVEPHAVESHVVESLAVKSRVAQRTAGLAREMEIGMPVWSEERCRDADSRPRFIAVHFPRWVIDLEVALLRRAMARCSRADHEEIAVDASPSINAPGFLAGIDLPLIVVREHHRVQHVVGICPLAYAAGVRVGMTMAQAEAMCSGGSAACQAPASAGPKGDAIARRAWRWRQLQILVGHAHPSCETVTGAPSPKALGGIPWRERIVSLTGDMMAVAWSAVVARKAIERLAQCLQRWIPIVAIDTTGCADTLVGDLTGCATLYRRRFRTEQALLQRIGASLMRRGVRPRLATASTVGAAMAMARSAHAAVSTDADAVQHVAIPDGRELAYLSPLPISSLRLDAASVEALRSVEVSTIGQLAALGRQGVASRLSGGPCAEALGRADPRSSVGKLGGARALDALARLDQALGRSEARAASCLEAAGIADGDGLVLLREQTPWTLRHDFESPTARPEALMLACGVLLERLLAELRRRHQGLHAATWTFHHLDVPADTSTDATRGCHGDGNHGGGNYGDMNHGGGNHATTFTMRLARPSQRGTHLWSILRSRLERVPLDHAIESVECRIDHASRQRERQQRLVGSPSLALQREVATPCGEKTGEAENPGTAEWADLMISSFGPSAVHRPQRTPLFGEQAVHASAACVRRMRPTVVFATAEDAILRGGAECMGIAQSIAARTAWAHLLDGAQAGGSCVHPATGSFPMLRWRGCRWPVRAIAGWERVAAPWWEGNASGDVVPPPSRASDFHRTRSSAANSRTTDVSGVVRSRIAVGDGLWLFVEWPSAWARPRSGSGDISAWVDAADPDGHAPDAPRMHSAREMLSCVPHALLPDAWPVRGWFVGAMASLQSGVSIRVHGAWG